MLVALGDCISSLDIIPKLIMMLKCMSAKQQQQRDIKRTNGV